MTSVFFRANEVAAVYSAAVGAANQLKTAMEADTIQHGRSSKSQMSRMNSRIVLI